MFLLQNTSRDVKFCEKCTRTHTFGNNFGKQLMYMLIEKTIFNRRYYTELNVNAGTWNASIELLHN
jgi:hypothetical protein